MPDKMNYSLPILTAREVSARFEIPLRALKQYAELGIVKLAKPHPGTGTARRFSITNIVQVYTAWNLQLMGINQKKIETVKDQIIHALNEFLKDTETDHRYLVLLPSYTEYGPMLDVARSNTPRPLFIGIVSINLPVLLKNVNNLLNRKD